MNINKLSIENKRVIVTGGCGFIGINLVEELVHLGAHVSVLDLPSSNWDIINKNIKQVKVDIMNPVALAGVFSGIDIIYHLAARTDLNGKKIDDYSVNYIGTCNILNEIKNCNSIRFVFYSTQLVVGIFNETRFINEDEPYRTKTLYGESKIIGEKKVKEYCNSFNIPYTIIRPTSVYGPWGDTPYKQFFRSIKYGKYFHVGKADNLVSLVYVKNLVDLTILASLNEKAVNETYFGNDFHPYTMREIVDVVAAYYAKKIFTLPSVLVTIVAYLLGIFKIFGFNVPLYPFRLKNIKSNYCYNIQRSIDIGYFPKYNLQTGINESLDWYEKNSKF
jgi:nucleoside-diphosphate-sugar epimerase